VENVKGYLYRTIVHHVVNAARLQESYARTLKKYAEEIEISVNNQGARIAFITDEQKNTVFAFLARYLQRRKGEAFLLKYRDDCSILEIATRMGINKRTVSRYLSESVQKLQRRLATE
jgi:RNA polymerase sigma factor (sigma-70 family)